MTPFGKLEFEFEPKSRKEEKDRERKQKTQEEAAKNAAKALKKAERQAQQRATGGGRGGSVLFILLAVGFVLALIALAYWLFARPGDQDEAVPPEFRNYEPEREPAPQTFLDKTRSRIREAVRAGRQASRETQREQEERLESMTGGR
jgi:hypothetical protein